MKLKTLLALLISMFASQSFAAVNDGKIECNVKEASPYKKVQVTLGELAGDCMDFEQGVYGSAIKMYPGEDSDLDLFESACIDEVQPERADFKYTRKVEGKMANDNDTKVTLMLNPKNDQKLVVLNTKTVQANIIRVQCKMKPAG